MPTQLTPFSRLKLSRLRVVKLAVLCNKDSDVTLSAVRKITDQNILPEIVFNSRYPTNSGAHSKFIPIQLC